MKGPPSFQIGLVRFRGVHPVGARFIIQRNRYRHHRENCFRRSRGDGCSRPARDLVESAIIAAIEEREMRRYLEKARAEGRTVTDENWHRSRAAAVRLRHERAERRRRYIRSLFLHLSGDSE